MFYDDDDLIHFQPKYPHTLPQDWQDPNNPNVYEINATLATLKKMYAEQVKDLKQGTIDKTTGESNLRNIATNYQTIKSILFQPR